MDSFTLNKVEFDSVRRILQRFAGTSLGKALAGRIGPSRNPEVIARWLGQVSEMVKAIRDVSLPPLAGITDIFGAIERARPGGGAESEDFAAIASTLEGLGNIRQYLHALPEDLESLHSLAEGIGDFASELAAIRSILGADGTVKDEASQRLASIRREIADTAQHIHDVIYGYLRQGEVAKLLQNPVVTLHGDRYVLPVKAENRGRLPGVVHRASQSGATVFVEPNASVELNNRLADLYGDERAEIQRLLSQLGLRITARADELSASLRAAAGVDLISAKAQYAYQFDMTCPALTERGPLQLNQARHPLLLEQAHRHNHARATPSEARQEVVPIDVRLGSDFDILVITGSNTGGKTVTLKTVALLVLMAQSGLHIPARRDSTLPIFHDVFIDIGDEQSLEQSLSTFGAHIKRLRYILQKADRNCLVLLDELGSGTDPDEGGAIGAAVLDELGAIGCPAMVTTHLSVLKAYALNHERVDNASVDFDTATLRPTYHLRIGTPGESHAITVAQHLGLPGRVIDAARKHLGAQGKQFRRALRATGAARQVAEAARAEAQAAQVAAEIRHEDYESKLADLHRLQGEFETWLATLPELKAGDEVFVPSLRKTAHLVRLELHRQIALVDAGSLQVEVPLRDLMPDLGQSAVREQIASLRKQILDQARDSEAARAEAERLRQEYHRSLQAQRDRAKQYDAWLTAINRMKIGDPVPIARKPGTGTLVKVDLGGLRASVSADGGEINLPLQELFPQTGPFAPHAPSPPRRHDHGRDHSHEPAETPQPDRPMHRRSAESKAARSNHEILLACKPGEKVFVVPFNKAATLIRIKADKDQAVVQSGIFEMELPLSDLEPIRQ
ncbi:MAG: MutS2/Smr-associated SH3 domain-containing protein [Phycisphaerae bacterium]